MMHFYEKSNHNSEFIIDWKVKGNLGFKGNEHKSIGGNTRLDTHAKEEYSS